MNQARVRFPHAMLGLSLVASALGGLGACSSSEGDVEVQDPPAAQVEAGRCVYTSPFTQAEECRDYTGPGWSATSAEADCKSQQAATFEPEERCSYPTTLGACVMSSGTEDEYSIVFPGDDVSQCASFQRGCELFGGGKFVPAACEGAAEDPGGGVGTSGSVFQWPTQSCVDPAEGEPAGQSNGKVCTFNFIGACTEEGRKYADYGRCDDVLTQRPYWPAPPSDFKTPENDPRLSDPAFLGELAWVTAQVEACGCVCCHSEAIAPQGASNWYVEAGPVWTDSFYPTGLAFAAGWVDSSALGAYPAAENNGFSRDETGLPTTDVTRMRAFFEGELARRGFTKEDFNDLEPFGGPIYQQSLYTPSACEAGIGIDQDGKITWSGGKARYVYVMMPETTPPGVPPNLDRPEGTLFRLDVASSADPVASGITYGELLPGTKQGFPLEGAPAKLTPGQTYYLYVLADVGIPITRCLFTMPG